MTEGKAWYMNMGEDVGLEEFREKLREQWVAAASGETFESFTLRMFLRTAYALGFLTTNVVSSFRSQADYLESVYLQGGPPDPAPPPEPRTAE